MHKIYTLISIFLLYFSCRSSDLENACDPFSNSFLNTIVAKLLTGDKSPHCGIGFGFGSPDYWITDSQVTSIHIAHNRIYIGGTFQHVGPNTGSAAVIDSSTQKLVSKNLCPYLEVDGSVYSSLDDGSGGFYIGGIFTTVQGFSIENLAHILPNCKVDPSFKPTPDGNVRAIVKKDNDLYIGGVFNQVGSVSRPYVAKINASTGELDTSWVPGLTNGAVWALALYNDRLYVGGEFSSLAGAARQSFGAINIADASVNSFILNTGGSEKVLTLFLKNNSLFVGGDFTTFGGSARGALAEIDVLNETLMPWNPNISGGGFLYDIYATDTQIYVGGSFSTIGGNARNNVAAFTIGNTTSNSWNPNLDGVVDAIYEMNGVVYMGGFFSSIGGREQSYVGAVDAISGAFFEAFTPVTQNPIFTFHKIGNNLLMGGSFRLFEGRKRLNAASFDITTGMVTDWDPKPDSFPSLIRSDEQYVYLVGSFNTLYDGVSRPYFAQTKKDTGEPTDFYLDFNSAILNDLMITNDTLIAAGSFSEIEGITKPNLAAYSFSNNEVLNWSPNPNSTVYGMRMFASNLFAVGSFVSIGGITTGGVAKFNPLLQIDSNFTCTNDATLMYDLTVSGNSMIVAGDFSLFNTESRSQTALIEANNCGNLGPTYTIDNGVYNMDSNENAFFLSGPFTTVNGLTRTNVVKIDKETSSVSDWNVKVDVGSGTADRIILHQDKVFISGGFQKINGRLRTGFAVLNQNSGQLIL
ncbi:hypothetical protein EHQ46_07750 [Leptospira yanagawae]|uniref:Uncharacterized protein n=1 Tax=Leptospira yanagawae TaxID=293069 RepID=A0ABY2M286_9LEPT|nr:hypothetical protein [Leptospira yanagawae]TGL21737.1 hypothetical protein EHQ46_07750 [Leptospira yanagawae]